MDVVFDSVSMQCIEQYSVKLNQVLYCTLCGSE